MQNYTHTHLFFPFSIWAYLLMNTLIYTCLMICLTQSTESPGSPKHSCQLYRSGPSSSRTRHMSDKTESGSDQGRGAAGYACRMHTEPGCLPKDTDPIPADHFKFIQQPNNVLAVHMLTAGATCLEIVRKRGETGACQRGKVLWVIQTTSPAKTRVTMIYLLPKCTVYYNLLWRQRY